MPPPPCDVLLLAAFVPELAPLQAALGNPMCARVGRLDVSARVVGIGLPTAAAGAASHVGDLQPRVVVALGTCGAYATDRDVRTGAAPQAAHAARIGDVVVARRVRLVDAAVVAGTAQFPEPMSVEVDAHKVLVDGLVRAGARAVTVANTLAITVDEAASVRIARATDAQAEHLEAFGVATACAARGVPFAAVLGVANTVGSAARSEWRLHHHAAATAAADLVLRWIREFGSDLADAFERVGA